MNSNSELAEILRRNPELKVIDDYTAVRDEPSPVYESGVDAILATGDSGSFQSGDGWVKIVLAGERPQTWNKFWAGTHWQERRRYKSAAVESISNVLPLEFTPFTDPVRVQYDVYYNGRPQDWSNVCIKPYEDALRGTVVVDDDIRYILGGTVNVHIDKKNPRIETLYTVAESYPVGEYGDEDSFQSGDGWVKIVLTGERPQTWNKFWAGTHWQERRRYKSAAVESISNVLPLEFTPFTDPVRVQYDVYYNGRPQDWSNVCIKPYEDALRGTVVVDDDIRYILGGTVNVHIDKKNPRIETLFTVA